jgi:hypothetical protein
MIRCILFIDPGGITPIDQWEVLGRIDIENDLLGSIETGGQRGTYIAQIYKKRKNKVFRVVKLHKFPRKSYHPWEMVRQILNLAAEQNKGKI